MFDFFCISQNAGDWMRAILMIGGLFATFFVLVGIVWYNDPTGLWQRRKRKKQQNRAKRILKNLKRRQRNVAMDCSKSKSRNRSFCMRRSSRSQRYEKKSS